MKSVLFYLFLSFATCSFCQEVCHEGSYEAFGDRYRTKLNGTGNKLIWTFERWGDCVCKVELTKYNVENNLSYWKWKKLSGPAACNDNLSYVVIGQGILGMGIYIQGYKNVYDEYDNKYKIEKDDFYYSLLGCWK
jgi:hypothetical protein